MKFAWHDIAAAPRDWDARVQATEQSLFHLSPVLNAHRFGVARLRGVILSLPAGEPRLLGGLLRASSGRVVFESLAFPALDDPEIVEALVVWMRKQGVDEVRFGSFTGGVEPYRGPRYQVSERLEFPWRLTEAADSRRRRLRSNHRRKISRLERQPLSLRPIERHQAAWLTQTRAQWARRRGERLTPRAWLKSYRYHARLHRHLTRTGIGRLYGLFDTDDRLLSLAYMLEHGRLSFYMLGASSPEGYRLGASMRLFWDLAQEYTDRGIECLHLGGVPAAAANDGHDEHGVFRFKHGFGIEPVQRLTLSTAG